MGPKKPPAINATYCLHCTHLCKQPATVQVMACPNRDYVTARLPDKVYRERVVAKADE